MCRQTSIEDRIIRFVSSRYDMDVKIKLSKEAKQKLSKYSVLDESCSGGIKATLRGAPNYRYKISPIISEVSSMFKTVTVVIGDVQIDSLN